ncbi:sensor domain-containing protein [Actinokineospora auranticolor]|uniref:Putative sensor protein n=1 Tax=Actinokineospora auranticolor TaxID=155976 RepID=A0A2S6GU90_9PSEU|nr:sensor domain-containing protein [Actinokineospora auranticolor]PPK68780.1 putative sensor protein [Actinokineospora auranticolor]
MTTTFHQDGTRPNPSVLGSLGYLLMNLPVGIAGFVTFVVLLSVGVGTAVVWVGLPVLALAVVAARVSARVERARVYAMLDTYIASPYPPLPERGRWKARVRDSSTWKDMAYFLVLLPVGIAEFTTVVVFWSLALGATFLPVYYRFLPDGEYRVFDTENPVWVVDSFVEALAFTGLGLVVFAIAIPLTRAMGRGHARFARALLGPAPSAVRFDAAASSPLAHEV